MTRIIEFPDNDPNPIHNSHLEALLDTQIQGLHFMKESLEQLTAAEPRACDLCSKPVDVVYPTKLQFCSFRCYVDFQLDTNLDPEHVRQNAHFPKPFVVPDN